MARPGRLVVRDCVGKIRSLLPYQPVYSKEMSDKIEAAEHNLSRSHRSSLCKVYSCSADCEVTSSGLQWPRLV